MTLLFKTALKPHILKNSIKVSLIVGTILNLINQGEHFLSDGSISYAHLIMNYLVPYLVSTYSASINEISTGKRNED
ncbi:MAG: nitrate/nitrite transporter NrtS [Methylotenera sp.]|uniref:nitrate/nitrite transporter NrtS n=1 Tax=Methylotenera sp. TaxID=2051956 RepID=UPI0024895078|nr:nitrate/nitrite transporter NrtS [Methylotenera sp.]MDI1309314.1 nitrate/nitrite transporter NrtS [Methylotenera sp.]